MTDRMNHLASTPGVWVPYNGLSFNDWYKIWTRDGIEYPAAFPANGFWAIARSRLPEDFTHSDLLTPDGLRIPDEFVDEICLLTDAEVVEAYPFSDTGTRRLLRNLRQFNDQLSPDEPLDLIRPIKAVAKRIEIAFKLPGRNGLLVEYKGALEGFPMEFTPVADGFYLDVCVPIELTPENYHAKNPTIRSWFQRGFRMTAVLKYHAHIGYRDTEARSEAKLTDVKVVQAGRGAGPGAVVDALENQFETRVSTLFTYYYRNASDE